MTSTRFGLQSKIIIIIAVAVVCVVSVSTYIAMLLTRQLVEEETYRKAVVQARATAHQLVNDDAFANPQKLLRDLQQMKRDFPGVKQADVYLHRPNHHLAASTAPLGQHLELDNISGIESYNEFERPGDDAISIESSNGKYWIIGMTIHRDGVSLGCLNLKVSKSQTNFVTHGLVARNLLLMLASLIAVILVIHLFFLRWIRRPIKEMVRVMESAEAGRLNVRASVKSNDEIGQLAEHLNRTLGVVENFNIELGQRIRGATAELARRNEELKRINEELFETQKSLARSERLAVAGQLAASLAHEIGTPLNSISGHVQLLARRKAGDAAYARRLQIIERQIDHIVRTVRQLLSWTRKFDLSIESIDLAHVIEESILLSSPSLQLRKINVHASLAVGCPKIYGDPGHLQRVFLNLINNSMDAMPRGGDLKIGLNYSASVDGREVKIEIIDTGLGINRETLPHIFDPMFTTKRIGTGAGLGLAICDQIICQHAGTIRVESELNHGTKFTIVLPIDCREKLDGGLKPTATTTGVVA